VIGNRYGSGNGTIWMDNVECVGHETSIANCAHSGWGDYSCGYEKQVSIACGESPVHYGSFDNLLYFHIYIYIYILI